MIVGKKVHVNTNLYPELNKAGGDRLIAFYCHLKAAKGRENRIKPIITANGRVIKHLNLIRKVTGSTKSTCSKYISKLEELGLCNFSKDGGFYLMGNNKTQAKYESKFRVTITVGNNLAETALLSYAVRIKALEKKQQESIKIKQFQTQLISRIDQNIQVSFEDYKVYKKLSKDQKSLDKLDKYCDKVVLSRMGFAKYKDGSKNSNSKGYYWKTKLKSAGIIKTRRNNKFIMKCSKWQYNLIKQEERNPRYNYYKGAMYEERISEFTCASFSDVVKPLEIAKTKDKMKPKEYLGFDFLAFLVNQPQ